MDLHDYQVDYVPFICQLYFFDTGFFWLTLYLFENIQHNQIYM